MNVETIVNYINVYGYLVIFLFLFFGIIGIPAPEESLLFLVGVLSVHHQLSLGLVILCSIFGAFMGMQTGYACGKYVGHRFVKKYGRYIGLTDERWEKVKSKYSENVKKTIVIGFYLPGIRQISPYFAGMNNIPFERYFRLSLIGTLLWTIPFILAGYYAGKLFHINPDYVPYAGIVFLVIFIPYVMVNYIKSKKAAANNSAK